MEDLVQKMINAVAEILLDMESREIDLYWYGQLTAILDGHGIDIYEITENHVLKPFERFTEVK